MESIEFGVVVFSRAFLATFLLPNVFGPTVFQRRWGHSSFRRFTTDLMAIAIRKREKGSRLGMK